MKIMIGRYKDVKDKEVKNYVDKIVKITGVFGSYLKEADSDIIGKERNLVRRDWS